MDDTFRMALNIFSVEIEDLFKMTPMEIFKYILIYGYSPYVPIGTAQNFRKGFSGGKDGLIYTSIVG